MELNSHKTGLAVGSFFGLWHLIWSLLVALGLAKPLIDFILGLHFIQYSYSLAPFSLGTAALLVIITALVGYVAGWVFATLWNKLK